MPNKAGQEVVLVFDPTPQNGDLALLVLGIVDHKRVLPLAWRVLPQQEAWPERQISYLRTMVAEVTAALPPDCTVTLLADRGITGPEVGDLVTRPGPRWAGPVQVCKDAGWRLVELTSRWDRAATEPWVLVSDRPAGPDRVREYRRRTRAEATYQDCKRRGFDLERSKGKDQDRFDRLLLALYLALWWGTQLGLRVIRTGQRRRFDRADRRDLRVLRLGRMALLEDLWPDRCPPLPFHMRQQQWRYAWLT